MAGAANGVVKGKAKERLKLLPFSAQNTNITPQMLRSLTNDPLGSITFLDLSFSGIQRINGLAFCPNIEVAILHGNCIDILPNLRCCKQLWKIDLSCNKLKNLSGFEYFETLGTLNLCENDIDWSELLKIRHLQILNLNLLGNEKLVKDRNYRKHVVVNLPLLWCLDGKLILAKEVSSAKHFLETSIRSQNPIWMKLPNKQRYVPSFMKNSSNIAFGKRAISLSRQFAKNEQHNKELDKKRLQYLSEDLSKDTSLEFPHLAAKNTVESLFMCRSSNIDECNMLLILLTCSLLFSVPMILMKDILQVCRLTNIGALSCEEIFGLPLQVKTSLVSLLVSNVKLERDDFRDYGISAFLYQKLEILSTHLTRVAYGSKDILISNDKHHVISTEFVKLFCLVPNFVHYLEEPNIMEIIVSATNNRNIKHQINTILKSKESLCHEKALINLISSAIEIAEHEERTVSLKLSGRKNPKISCDFSRVTQLEVQKKTRPATAPPLSGKHGLYFGTEVQKLHNIGEMVLLSPQRIGHIIAIPDIRIILVQLDTLPQNKYKQDDHLKSISGKTEHSLCYVDKESLVWDRRSSYWVSKDCLPSKKQVTSHHPTVKPEAVRFTKSKEVPTAYMQYHSHQKSDQKEMQAKLSSQDHLPQTSLDLEPLSINQEYFDTNKSINQFWKNHWLNCDTPLLLDETKKKVKCQPQPRELRCSKLSQLK
eukprot:gene9916-10931_t